MATKKLTKECAECGKTFGRTPGVKNDFSLRKYCSCECYQAARKKRTTVTKPCKHCQKEFTSQCCRDQKYCSPVCSKADKAASVRKCEYCKEPISSPTNRKYCSTTCRNLAPNSWKNNPVYECPILWGPGELWSDGSGELDGPTGASVKVRQKF